MMTRIVMMKMISSTNITSTRGVTLMSAIGSPSLSPPILIAMSACYLASGRRSGLADRRRRLFHAQAHLRARNQVRMQFMSEVADHFLHTLIACVLDFGREDGLGHGEDAADGRQARSR